MTRVGTPVDFVRAAAAGVVGTGTMTALWMVEPSIGLPKIAVGHILSTFMSVSVAHLRVGNVGGWIAHFAFGVMLALLYARFVVPHLPGVPEVRGALYGTLLFIAAQLVFMPLVGGGFFARGDIQLLAGSLLGHLVYGVVVGWIYDLPFTSRPVVAPLPR